MPENNTPQNNNVPEPSDMNKKLEDCEKQRDEYLAGWQRAKADFINYRKDEFKRLEEIAKYGTEDLLGDLIGVIDSFDLAIIAMEKSGSAPTPKDQLGSESRRESGGVEKGVYMIRSQLVDLLKKRGVEKISAEIGKQFDPSFAEAIAEAESDKPPGTVLEEIEPGWKLHDKILRPARVKIAKSK